MTLDANYLLLLTLIYLWTIPWKGVALWKAARNGSLVWFLILLIVNTVGILEILYIFIFSKRRRIQEGGQSSDQII